MDIIATQTQMWRDPVWSEFFTQPTLARFEKLPGLVWFETDEIADKHLVNLAGDPFLWMPAKITMIGVHKVEVMYYLVGSFCSKQLRNDDYEFLGAKIMRIGGRPHRYYLKTLARRDKLHRILG